MGDLTIVDKEFLKHWKSLNFESWNEQDVREEFIAPLLRVLGYAKGTVNDIVREKTLNLSAAYHRIGRKQVAIDYVPTVRLKTYWIIEAKPGSPKAMDYGDYLQAHLYANHPEIRSRYIVLTNGWEIRVYDAVLSDGWDDHILAITQDNCQDNFGELKQFLSARSMVESIRKLLLTTIVEGFMASVDSGQLDEFRSEVNRMYYQLLPVIKKNETELKTNLWRQSELESAKWLSSQSNEAVLQLMNRPVDPFPVYAAQLYDRIKRGNQDARNQLLEEIAMRYRGRPHAIFRVNCLDVLLQMYVDNVDASNSYAPSVDSAIEELISSNMKYWAWDGEDKSDHIGFALCHLDNTCARIAYKCSRRFAMKTLQDLVTAKKRTLSAEDFIREHHSVAEHVLRATALVYDYIWNAFAGLTAKKIWKQIWNLQAFERHLDTIPAVEYQDPKEADILWLDHYGVEHDMLIMGTFSVVQKYKSRLKAKELLPSISWVLNMTRDEAKASIPKPIEPPAEWAAKQIIPFEQIVDLIKSKAERT